jgi:hypothetical protein
MTDSSINAMIKTLPELRQELARRDCGYGGTCEVTFIAGYYVVRVFPLRRGGKDRVLKVGHVRGESVVYVI